jgi:hypothetical protein
MLILEGGNVFKSKDGKPLTQRINQADVAPTIKWIENILGIDLLNNTLGTTGKNPTSGDLDIAVDVEENPKEEVYKELVLWVSQNIPDANVREYVAKTGIEVHFRTPINGNPANGYVQTDLMFGEPEFMKWSSQGEPPGEFKGQHRQILLASIAKYRGYRWSGFVGLTNRSTEQKTTNPQEITNILLGPGHNPQDLTSINKILDIIKDDPNYEEMVADAAQSFPKYGVNLPEKTKGLPTISLQEANVSDGPRIQHAEDLIFWEGSKGAIRALDALTSLATEEGQKTTSLKWDGSPAVMFGRDENGQFIFTDKSGFTAKGYDGKAKTPEELENIFVNVRRVNKGKEVTPDYINFVGNLKNAFTIFEKSTPQDVRGFFFGDLLYTQTPKLVDGKYEFKPNIVNYKIDANSDLGKRIGQSKVGVVVHGQVDFEGSKSSVQDYNIFQGTDLLVVPPVLPKEPVKIDVKQVNSAKSKISSNASKIDDLLNKDSLRSLKISNLADLFYTYTNSKVDTGLQNLGQDFETWLDKSNVSENAKQNIKTYIQQNKQGFDALWNAVAIVMSVKNNIIRQLDSQDAPVKSSIGAMEGGEGYVIASPAGYIKLVDREGFTKANRMVQRESLIREQVEGHSVALFPGSFKPPHRGHMTVVSYLASNYDEVIILVSEPVAAKSIRSDITAQQATEIFNLYIRDAGFKNAIAIKSNIPSPVGSAYDIIQSKQFPANTKISIATSTKDVGRYPQESINKAAMKNPTRPVGNSVTIPAIADNKGKPVSATDFRATIASVISGQQAKEALYEFMPEVSEQTKEKVANILIGNQQTSLTELLKMIDEISTMAGGTMEVGAANDTLFKPKTKKKKGTSQMNEEELQLRQIIRNAIKLHKENKIKEFKKNKLEEQHLRYIVRKLIMEAGEDQPIHDNTGINVLEDLLKKIIPVIQTDYKIMTTSEIQRKSFRAHILNAIQNSLKPELYRKEETPPGAPQLQEKKVKIDLDSDEQLDSSKFIDVFDTKGKKAKEEEDSKTPEARLGAGLEKHGLDSTGRNMALQTFRKLDNSIMDAYSILDDVKDKDLFYDYLITNLKLYFDKFEEEMLDMPKTEPTTPEYKAEKQKKDTEDEDSV